MASNSYPSDSLQYIKSALAGISNMGTIVQAAGGSVAADVSALLLAGTIGANGTTTLGDVTTQNAAILTVGTALINMGSLLTAALAGTQADNR